MGEFHMQVEEWNCEDSMKYPSKTAEVSQIFCKSKSRSRQSLDLRTPVYLLPQLCEKRFSYKFARIFIFFSIFGLGTAQACSPSLSSGVSKSEDRGQESKISVTAATTAKESVTSAQGTGPKKLIYYGWGIRDTQYARDSWRQMEEMPFDGVGIAVAIDRLAWQKGKTGTDNQLSWQVMGERAFHEEGFRDAIADLKEAKWKRFTDNFLPLPLCPGSAKTLNWFDEQRWHTVVNNLEVLAKIAAEGGMKGLILDPEQYSKCDLFSYPGQRQKVDRSFEEHVAMARQRGRQVMTAVAAHLPRGVFLSVFGHSFPFLERLQRGADSQGQKYGLLPAFYDGLLEAMPSGAYLVDGYESGFAFKEQKKFLKAYGQIHKGALTLSAVPDRYQEKVKAGFGLWLDYNDRPGYFTPEELRQAVSNALSVSDGYVWIYSHNLQFFPPSPETVKPYIKALAEARSVR